MRCRYVLNLNSYIFTVFIKEDEFFINVYVFDAMNICSVRYTMEKEHFIEHVSISCSTLPLIFMASGDASHTANQILDALSKVFKESIVIAEQCVEG